MGGDGTHQGAAGPWGCHEWLGFGCPVLLLPSVWHLALELQALGTGLLSCSGCAVPQGTHWPDSISLATPWVPGPCLGSYASSLVASGKEGMTAALYRPDCVFGEGFPKT